MERQVCVGAVIVGADDRVLLIKRARAPGAGTWSVVGGKVEAGESLEAAVLREVREETRLDVRVGRQVAVVNVDRDGFALRIHDFICTPLDPRAVPVAGDDALEVRWTRVDELEALGVEAALREVVRDSVNRMRTSHICPKCGHNEILFIPQLADRDDKDAVRPFVLHVVHYDWKDDNEMGKLQAYVCHGCGFTELYTANVAQVAYQKIPGAKVLKGKK